MKDGFEKKTVRTSSRDCERRRKNKTLHRTGNRVRTYLSMMVVKNLPSRLPTAPNFAEASNILVSRVFKSSEIVKGGGGGGVRKRNRSSESSHTGSRASMTGLRKPPSQLPTAPNRGQTSDILVPRD